MSTIGNGRFAGKVVFVTGAGNTFAIGHASSSTVAKPSSAEPDRTAP